MNELINQELDLLLFTIWFRLTKIKP
ncbi:uncharacterized protein METZ01_LOCUS288335 [marine metagenome]|uniref:Uncharacterized protein n=1 Tax=marine metagenome TaxID=408172 RepID=A0A382LKS5_9ZZZZ